MKKYVRCYKKKDGKVRIMLGGIEYFLCIFSFPIFF